MMDIFYYVVVASVLAVVIILMIGLGGFFHGGEFNRRYANRLMRLRIIGQAIAVVLILAYVAVRQMGG
ncbi:MAG: twin transmembrane helix small protein [Paracoccaceae bacterium]|nr:twin transmembrane helix small protein [Paracoccaceae bacterium]MDE2912809.1 twin transmembrane helix small protein [Paracoccaceae bacterium]